MYSVDAYVREEVFGFLSNKVIEMVFPWFFLVHPVILEITKKHPHQSYSV